MSYEVPGFGIGTLVSSADFSAKQYYFAKAHTAAGQAALCGDGEPALGVIQNAPASGRSVEIMSFGISKVAAGAAIATIGTEIASDGTGRAIAAATGKRVRGITLEAAAGAGSIISVYIFPGETHA